ncbi:ATP-binding protein [Syntrophorhabdus aromaticivorans]|jgi:anti-sigma regulatory factor (Ser/Thr protein kinase)|uniref:ATP-binding protein n=1 Tax=Syntrophorhabdus aromaticivorans TaxID=328301 RepID=UPI00041B3792|nr:ATP-binding protein [Syntrophorhabdus aromaticivorans]HBA56145.1 ATP-binding protein [Syntrophorhabdus aromaticivorans]
MNSLARKASLTLDTNPSFTPLVLDFAEKSARAFGMTEGDASRVRLAGEEVFGYLCYTAKTGSEVTIEALNSLYSMEIRFTFKTRSFDPYAFNLTAFVTPEDGQTDNLGLLIGSRAVDRFSIVHNHPRGLVLSLIKEKAYPPWSGDESTPGVSLKDFVTKRPDDEMVKRFVREGVYHYDETIFPEAFRIPSRMVDMAAQGDYHVLVACGTGIEGGEVGGGIIWRFIGEGMVQFYGPYVFDRRLGSDIAGALVDGFLSAVAKTDGSGTYTCYTTADFPVEYFEPLGEIEYSREDGTKQARGFFYRQLKEDAGSHVWASGALEPFLHQVYNRLFLPRQIVFTSFEGERRAPHSVLSVEFDRPRSSVTIRPVWDGEDYTENLAGHVRILEEEGLKNIFFDLDLGAPWQAKLIPTLFEGGFKPVLLLPYAGQADVVVFQHVR